MIILWGYLIKLVKKVDKMNSFDFLIKSIRKGSKMDTFDSLVIEERPPKAGANKIKPSEVYMKALSELPLLYNEITGEATLEGKSIYDPSNKAISELIYTLRNVLEGRFSKEAFYDYMVYYSKKHTLNVVKDLFDQKWDGVKRLTNFCSYLHTNEACGIEKPLTQWMVCTIQKWLKGSQSFMLALTGAPGIGKDYLFEFLNPFDPEYLVSSALDSRDKDAKIRATTNLIWVIGEVEGSMTRNDIESMKAFLTASSHSVRAPYGRKEVKLTVKASFAATANSPDFIRDDSGRRIMVVALDSINKDYSLTYGHDDVRQLWLEAFEIGEAKPEEYKYFSAGLRASIYESNVAHKEKEGFELLIDGEFEIKEGVSISAGAVYEYLLSKGNKTNPRMISKYLRSLGAIATHTRKGTAWLNLSRREPPYK